MTQTTKGKKNGLKKRTEERQAKKRKASRSASNMEKLKCSSFSKSNWKGQFKVRRQALSNLTRTLSTESVSYIQEHVKEILGSSDEGTGTAVISDSKDKENDRRWKRWVSWKWRVRWKLKGF